MLPNFLVIGAQKCGTTSLLRVLESHGDVYVTRPRETAFFVHEQQYTQGSVAYERTYFARWNGQRAVGEKCPEYLFQPDVPERILTTLGKELRLIVCLRSPAQRAFSHYRHNLQQFWEDLPFEIALQAEAERSHRSRYHASRFGYLARGRYAEQIERWLKLFPRENFLFLVFEEDIANQSPKTWSRVFSFLGVDDRVLTSGDITAGRPNIPTVLIAESSKKYVTPDGTVAVPPGAVVLDYGANKIEVVRAPSAELLAFASRVKAATPRRLHLERDEEMEFNRSHFGDDIDRTAELVNRDLGCWLNG